MDRAKPLSKVDGGMAFKPRKSPAGGRAAGGRRCGLSADERGTLTLEAAIVVPVFMTIVLAVLLMFRLAVIETALQQIADNAVRQTAVALYPVDAQLRRIGGMTQGEGFSGGLEELAEIAPEPVKSVLEQLLSEAGASGIAQSVLDRAFDPVVRHFAPGAMRGRTLDPGRITAEGVRLPYVHHSEPYFGLTVRYEMKLHLPFYSRTIVIRKSSWERVWFGA